MTLPFGLDRTSSASPFRTTFRRTLRNAFSLVCLAVLAVACRTAGATPPLAAHAGGAVPVGGVFTGPYGVAVDRSGNVFVADHAGSAVYEIVAVGGTVSSSSTVNTIGSGFSSPAGVAVDASGNVFVTDGNANAVYEIVAVGGIVSSSSTVNTIGSGFNGPYGVAVDASGNVFVADQNTNAVKEIVAGSNGNPAGVVNSLSTVNTINNSFNNPTGVAVDASGNVFVADYGNHLVKEIVAGSNGNSTGVVSPTSTVITLATAFSFSLPPGVAVDGSGNVFVADLTNNAVYEIVAVGGLVSSNSTVNTIGSGFNQSTSVAVDASGNVFVADYGNHAVKEIVAAAQKFPATAVASTSASLSIPFTFDGSGSIGTPVVLTQGAAGLDFADAGTGTCTTNTTSHVYNAGDSCTVDVTFTPKYPGQRLGAVQLTTLAGAPIATANIYGTGTGPLVTFPGNTAVNTIASGFNDLLSMAVDASGNIFVVDYLGNAVKEIVAVGGVISPSSTVNTIGSGFNRPTSVAVDGSGNVFVADSTSLQEIVAVGGVVSSSSTVIPVGSGFVSPQAVAVDGSGNVFVADSTSLKEIVAIGGVVSSSSAVNTISSSFSFPTGVAVDGNGNVFVVDNGSHAVKEIVATNGVVSSTSAINTIGSNFVDPYAVVVDASGNVFVADANGHAVKEIVAVNGVVSSSSTVNTLGSGFELPVGVAVDGRGNVFVADQSFGRVQEIGLGNPPSLSFATATNVGSTDTTDGPQTVTVANSGNAALTFTVPTSGNNPSISADFTLDSSGSGTCPLTTGTPNTLAAGASCTLPISFAPTVAGTISGSLVLTDTNLNANPSTTQTISLSGTGQLQTAALAFAAIPSHTFGDTPFIVTATSVSSGAVTYSVTSGPATIAGNAVTLTGVGTVVLSASQAATATYAAATASTSFAVIAATPTLAFAAIPSHTLGDAPFMVTATSASSGAVTYSVTSGPATIAGSTVTLTGVGTVVLSASQAATATYTAATASTSFTVGAAPVLDFSMNTPATQTQSVARGGAATFSFSFAPTSGAYPATVSFAATGLPTGATASFSPSTIPVNGGAQTVTLTVQTSAVAALSRPLSPLSHRGGLVAFALLFLPLAGTRRMRRVARKLGGRTSLALFLLLSVGAMAGLSGCGGSSKPTAQSQSYTITVTATSGSVQHSSTVTLQVH